MQDITTEFSFVLKPAEHGIGVFATHDIKKGTYLRFFGNETIETDVSVLRNKKDVPEFFRKYCVDRDDSLQSPRLWCNGSWLVSQPFKNAECLPSEL